MIRDELEEIIITTLGVKKEQVKEDAKFIEDLGADSLDVTELILNVEDKFNIKIKEDDVGKFKKVKDLIDYIEDKNI